MFVSVAAPPSKPPLLDHKDLALLGLLPGVALVAWLVPERFWQPLAHGLAGLRLRLRRERTAAEVGRLEAVTGARPLPTAPEACWQAHLAHNYHAWLLLLRAYRRDGAPRRVRLEGGHHLDAALAAGKGAILWVAPFAYSDLITKCACNGAGYAVHHLSRDTHGFSTTRFGRALLNPIQTRIEARYLAERLVMTDTNRVGALRALTRHLKANRPISITVAATGQQAKRMRFLGGRIDLATGAFGLAWQTGAPILPVFTLMNADGSFTTHVEPALPLERTNDRAAALDALLATYVPRLERRVLAAPDQFCLPYLATDDQPDSETTTLSPKAAATG